ncbi:glutamyl-tRNA reductase [Taibaiella sp. KBW10]|uniref:glutamyl-tRNA reductase n=1 Tax=Taibaiella sp. KBW10 TaxID=2153357 RepID=UPI000F5A487B|nr:glutamyl-tRNA reductase [Taibaiella sp. KBW10]RQO29983.1 glutamyl-tRNA reductase [Taibaiella sp. KBW10]
MILAEKNNLQDFWCIGISHQGTNTEIRSRFAISNEAYAGILANAATYGVGALFVISTCNRTEVYGIAKDAELLMALICQYTEGDIREFKQYAYIKERTAAIQHLFSVAAGIDSQILGDYEIVGQLKTAYHFAREQGSTNAFIDRLFNTVLQSSRAIRSQTDLSSGTVSVAYAAVQFLKEHITDLAAQKVLVIGVGDIGRNTCKNLIQEVGLKHIAVVNRTEEKAAVFAAELGIQKVAFADLNQAIKEFDVIIVATNASKPIVTTAHLDANDVKTIIDLSIPNNVAANLRDYPHIKLANVDDLSKINDATLQRREEEVPKAKALISFYIHEFAEWYLMRQNVPVLKVAKEKIKELNGELADAIEHKEFSHTVQRVLNNMAVKLKSEHNRPGCSYIEAINDYIKCADPAAKAK